MKSKEYTAEEGTVVTVAAGRGFVVDGKRERLIITAAHCLPFFPPCMSFSHTEERTYKSILGRLGEVPTVWAECYFVDAIADIAILGTPDGEEYYQQARAYDLLVENATAFSIADAPEQGSGWLLSLDCHWFECKIQRVNNGPIWTSSAEQGIRGGMSGSPILSGEGIAIGVITAATLTEGGDESDGTGGPDPVLTRNLPGWMLASL